MGGVRVGEGLVTPFTRINIWLLEVYAWLVKGEGCF